MMCADVVCQEAAVAQLQRCNDNFVSFWGQFPRKCERGEMRRPQDRKSPCLIREETQQYNANYICEINIKIVMTPEACRREPEDDEPLSGRSCRHPWRVDTNS